MAFKRALWHSGLTYKRECDACRAIVQYTDHSLDFRPWFADGFVYCPKCKKPLRHNEMYAIDADNKPQETYVIGNDSAVIEKTVEEIPNPTNSGTQSKSLPMFCGKCGNKFNEDDMFCSSCGNKREQ